MATDRDSGPQRSDGLNPLLTRYGLYLVAVAALFLLALGSDNMTTRFFREQDAPALIASGLFLVLLGRFSLRGSRRLVRTPPLPTIVLAAFVVLFAWCGWWLVFGGYPFSRDEFLADFDSEILKRGLLIAPIPLQWQGFAAALMPLHMLEISPEAGWVSSYLPVNALFRAGMDLLVDPSVANPLLAGLSILALSNVARRLWADRPALAALPVLLLALSPQFLVTAMTPFAMTGHLALNLVWLSLFLNDSRRWDMAALAVGFLATGLHQIVFHPLFVLPFILELLAARRWNRAALFIGGYIVIGLFWASYWQIAEALNGFSTAAAAGGGAPILIQRLLRILTSNDLSAFPLMMLNLLRFAAWQHILLLPLLALAWPSIRNGEGIARPLALGMLLMLLLVLILLPWQGVGWGYRYLHGLLGNACLLGGYGWLRSQSRMTPDRRRTSFILASAFTGFALLPFQIVQTGRMVEPSRLASAFIEKAQADIVIVDPSGIELGHELVRNRPDLGNRPILIDLGLLTASQIHALCNRPGIRLFDERHARAFGMAGGLPPVPQRQLLNTRPCAAPLPLP